jgi:hypothetical protein
VRLAEAGLVRRVRRGRWALRIDLDPFVLPAYLTAPYPAYVSLWSALARHGMIEQLPRALYAISPDRTRDISTGFGPVSIHHVSAPLFGGFTTTGSGIHVATPEKALFDALYVAGPAGGGGYLPELQLPAGFDEESALGWLERNRIGASANARRALTAPCPAPGPARLTGIPPHSVRHSPATHPPGGWGAGLGPLARPWSRCGRLCGRSDRAQTRRDGTGPPPRRRWRSILQPGGG